MGDVAVIKFIVPGQPIPCERPRVYRGRAFTPKRSKDYQDLVRRSFMVWDGRAEPDLTQITGDLFVSLRFYRADKRRCDLDNLTKSILDGLNGVAFEDDSQITSLAVTKQCDPANPRAEVFIQEADDTWL